MLNAFVAGICLASAWYQGPVLGRIVPALILLGVGIANGAYAWQTGLLFQ